MKEKIAYLQGLVDGMKLDDAQQVQLMKAIIDAMQTMADTIEQNATEVEILGECIDNLYDELDAMDDCFDEGDFEEVICPNCGETVYFDEDMLDSDETLICPSCNATIIPGADEEE